MNYRSFHIYSGIFVYLLTYVSVLLSGCSACCDLVVSATTRPVTTDLRLGDGDGRDVDDDDVRADRRAGDSLRALHVA